MAAGPGGKDIFLLSPDSGAQPDASEVKAHNCTSPCEGGGSKII